MQIAVCDDNEMFLREIEGQLMSLGMVENVFLFSCPEKFLRSAKKEKIYDAVLMDIDLKQDNTGMDVAEMLLLLSPKTKIIYATGNMEYSQRILLRKANLSGFLSKPIDTELLQANLQKIMDSMSHENEPSLMLKQRGVITYIPLCEIIFIESKGHTVQVHTIAGEVITSYERLENLMRPIPAGFFQCHKSYIVNMRQIRRFESGRVVLKNDVIIPVSRSRYSCTKEAYFDYIGKSF